MMTDTANPNGLQARGLYCKSVDQFFSLMYGVYSGDNQRVWIAEVDFLNQRVTYRRYLAMVAGGSTMHGVIFNDVKYFIVASSDFVNKQSTGNFFTMHPSISQGIIYSTE